MPKPLPNKHGRILHRQTTNPVAGTEIQLGVPTNTRQLLKTVRFTLVTDATVTNRTVMLEVLDSATVVIRLLAPLNQTAGQTITYNMAAGGADRTTALNNEVEMAIPPELWLNDIFTTRINAINLQAGDDFSGAEYIVEEWVED